MRAGIDWQRFPRDATTNVPARLEREWLGRNLLRSVDHPLWRAKQRIAQQLGLVCVEDLNPVVSVRDNFDHLLIPANHVSRSPNDTYYVNAGHVLRTHTTAHQRQLLLQGPPSWLVAGDVYRRDEIDASHFPVFHQMDGARVFPPGTSADAAERDLKSTLEGLTRALFGPEAETRWREDYFPFTLPSWELDVRFNGEWLELLGSGLIHPRILEECKLGDRVGWAFGIGLERLAMVLYGVPDIRAFWSRDERFARQFAGLPLDARIAYAEFSRFPKTSRDISFWLPEGREADFHENQFFELVREVAGDLVETVARMDVFKHPKSGRTSHAFRIDYRSMERTLDNAEINALQASLRAAAERQLGVTLR